VASLVSLGVISRHHAPDSSTLLPALSSHDTAWQEGQQISSVRW
jgi:hypothetical protein